MMVRRRNGLKLHKHFELILIFLSASWIFWGCIGVKTQNIAVAPREGCVSRNRHGYQ